MKWILVLLACFSLCACATYPSPRVENGRYIHPAYGFSIEVPPNWVHTSEPPAWVKEVYPNAETAFFNQTTNGAILIIIDKTIFGLQILPPQKVFAMMTGHFEDHKKQIKENPQIKDYKFEVLSASQCYAWKDCPAQFGCIKLCHISNEWILSEIEFMKFKGEAEGYIFTCQKDDTCFVNLFLVSLDRTFEENRQVYEAVLRSLRSEN